TYTVSMLHHSYRDPRKHHSFPTRRSSDLATGDNNAEKCLARGIPTIFDGHNLQSAVIEVQSQRTLVRFETRVSFKADERPLRLRSEEQTSELQSLAYLVCRLLLAKKKKIE